MNIEALACGLPVAAFPVPGPADILGVDECGIHGGAARIGAFDRDLAEAIRRALTAGRNAAVMEATHYRWERCTELFLAGLATPGIRGLEQRAA